MKKINCILLIDDNKADNVYHSIVIKEANVCNHIKVAINGIEALTYINKAGEPDQSESFPKPDLIYLDINMPGMNGFEFLEEYRKLEEKLKSKVVIVMLTTSLNPDDHKKTMEYAEMSGFENKPLTIEMVRKDIEKYYRE